MNVLEFAHQILDMQDEINHLRSEVARLQKFEAEYNTLLDESIKHGEHMMTGWLNLLLSERITVNPQQSN